MNAPHIPAARSENTATTHGLRVLNAIEVLERAALGPESQGTAAQFLKCLGEGGMFVIENPLVPAARLEPIPGGVAETDAGWQQDFRASSREHEDDVMCAVCGKTWGHHFGRCCDVNPSPRRFAVSLPSSTPGLDPNRDKALELVARLREPRVTHHQISGDYEPYETVKKVHGLDPIRVEAADLIERLLGLDPIRSSDGEVKGGTCPGPAGGCMAVCSLHSACALKEQQ